MRERDVDVTMRGVDAEMRVRQRRGEERRGEERRVSERASERDGSETEERWRGEESKREQETQRERERESPYVIGHERHTPAGRDISEAAPLGRR